MATGELLSNGFGLFSTEKTDIGGGVNQTTCFPTWKDIGFIFSFDIYAAGLPPSSNADVELKRVVVIDGARTSDGVITDKVHTNDLPTWSGLTNAQGDLSLLGSIKSFVGNQFTSIIVAVAKTTTDLNQSFVISGTYQPHQPLPSGDIYVENVTSLAEVGQSVRLEGSGGDVSAMCLKLECIFTFELRDINGFVNETDITGIITACIDLDSNEAGTPQVTFPLTVIADGINKTVSPSNLNTSIERAVIPYNNTTEREVVHLDYRIKSTD